MFRRLAVTDLMNNLTLVAFAVFFAVFILITIWAMRLPRERVRRMENLPLEPDHHDDEHHA